MAEPPDRLITALADRYTIEREIGAGGMATVYLAHDLKHDRKVAIKVLRPELAAVLGAERFVQEIKTTASLQHPHILPLHDSGEADGFLYYVMPFVEGETLRDRLNREKQLGIDEAVRITTEVADALDYAHCHNVIHRDIKPENILLHDGRPMVADFGIALAVSAAAGGRMTESGLSLGTPHYMSPEQATAEKDLTNRSDIYSLGAMLYEMLTGNPPHVGSSAQQIIMRIVTEEAQPVTDTRKSVPPNVAAAVARALEKLPADRFESAAELSAALSNAGFRHGESPSAQQVGPAHRRPGVRSLPAVLVGLSLLAFLIGRWSVRPAPSEQTRLTITLPPGQAVTSAPAMSPDGRIVAFTAAGASEPSQLYIRRLDEFEPEPVAGTEDAASPFFSPDGHSIAFFARGQLFRWNLGGGEPQGLAEAPEPRGGTWGDDDVIVFVPLWNGGLYRVHAAASRSEPEPVIVPDGIQDFAFVFPKFVPGRPEVLFTAWGLNAGLWRLDLATGVRSEIALRHNSATATTSGHLLLAPNRTPSSGPGELLAVPYPSRSVSEAPPKKVLSGVHAHTMDVDLWLSVSRTGSLAYAPSDITQRSLVRVDQHGKVTEVTDQRGGYVNLALSPDGRRIAADVSLQIWLYEYDGGGAIRLAPENRSWNEMIPVWDPHTSRLIYSSNQSGNWDIYARVPGAAESEIILPKEGDQRVEAIAEDGTLVFVESHPETGQDLWLLPPGGPPTPWQATGAEQVHPDFSPDGRWLAYASNVTGRYEVYVGPVRGGNKRTQVTTEGGQTPVWSPKGDRLFYRRGATMMAVDVEGLDPFVPGNHRALFDGGWALRAPELPFQRSYDVTPDGEHFVMIRHEPEAIPDRIQVVVNWLEELKRPVPVK